MKNIKEKIFEYNRYPVISPWFKSQLNRVVDEGIFNNDEEIVVNGIVRQLSEYKKQTGVNRAFVGISGGIDSALTAALFQKAGYFVTGVIMPIHQKEQETLLGREACEVLGIQKLEVDLTMAYEKLLHEFMFHDKTLKLNSVKEAKRKGNLRARIRMMTLYNQASLHGGLVGSTDNFSELAAGFWTLHGDVGDVAPIQSLFKSWEVPSIADYMGVPESIIQAVPTDGLGISNSDEDQFGFSYLEFDIALLCLMYNRGISNSDVEKTVEDERILEHVRDRIAKTAFKRSNPLNIEHPIFDLRFNLMRRIDEELTNKE